jgi:hypothetical protein
MKLNIPLADLFDPSYIAELAALFAAIFLLRKKSRKWQLFIIYMSFIVAIETLGWLTRYVLKLGGQYDWIYNYYVLISTAFYLYILSLSPLMKPRKNVLSIILVGFIIIALGNMFFLQGLWTFNSYSEVLENIILATVCCYLMYKNLQEDNSVDLLNYDYFWLSNGLLFFSLGNITMHLFFRFLKNFYESTQIPIGLYIIDVLNVLLYGSLIIAFICRRKNLSSP